MNNENLNEEENLSIQPNKNDQEEEEEEDQEELTEEENEEEENEEIENFEEETAEIEIDELAKVLELIPPPTKNKRGNLDLRIPPPPKRKTKPLKINNNNNNNNDFTTDSQINKNQDEQNKEDEYQDEEESMNLRYVVPYLNTLHQTVHRIIGGTNKGLWEDGIGLDKFLLSYFSLLYQNNPNAERYERSIHSIDDEEEIEEE